MKIHKIIIICMISIALLLSITWQVEFSNIKDNNLTYFSINNYDFPISIRPYIVIIPAILIAISILNNKYSKINLLLAGLVGAYVVCGIVDLTIILGNNPKKICLLSTQMIVPILLIIIISIIIQLVMNFGELKAKIDGIEINKKNIILGIYTSIFVAFGLYFLILSIFHNVFVKQSDSEYITIFVIMIFTFILECITIFDSLLVHILNFIPNLVIFGILIYYLRSIDSVRGIFLFCWISLLFVGSLLLLIIQIKKKIDESRAISSNKIQNND